MTTDKNNTASAPLLYDQSAITRDSCGCFWHPDLPDGDEASDMRPLLLAQGFESYVVWGGSDEAAFPEEAMEDGGDAYFRALGDWQPKGKGDGWLIAAVMDTEDGPCAWLVRPLYQCTDRLQQEAESDKSQAHPGKNVELQPKPERGSIPFGVIQRDSLTGDTPISIHPPTERAPEREHHSADEVEHQTGEIQLIGVEAEHRSTSVVGGIEHLATSVEAGAARHTLATVKPPRDLRTKVRPVAEIPEVL